MLQPWRWANTERVLSAKREKEDGAVVSLLEVTATRVASKVLPTAEAAAPRPSLHFRRGLYGRLDAEP